jgi:hypothetical protein
MSENVCMVCVRVSEALEGNVAVSAVITNCSECDEPIWLSKASQDQMVEVGAKLICMQCFKPTEDARLMPPSRGVIEELIKHLTKQQHEKPTSRIRGITPEGG